MVTAFHALLDLRLRHERQVAAAEAQRVGAAPSTTAPAKSGTGSSTVPPEVAAALQRYETYATHAAGQLQHYQRRCEELERELARGNGGILQPVP